jgi:hypothetical protein
MTANDSKTAESPGWLELWISIDPVFAQAVKLKTDKWRTKCQQVSNFHRAMA